MAQNLLGLGRDFSNFLAQDYVLGELIGQGAYGKVYALHRLSDGKKYVIKVVDLKKSTLAKFRREVDIHSHISKYGLSLPIVTDVINEDKTLGAYITLRADDNLRSFLLNSSLTLEETLWWLRKARVLKDALHTREIYHGDLRLENIVVMNNFRNGDDVTNDLRDESRLYLIDFDRSMKMGETPKNISRLASLSDFFSRTNLERTDTKVLEDDMTTLILEKFNIRNLTF